MHAEVPGDRARVRRCLLETTSRKGAAIDLWYSGKTHDFGENIQAIFDPRGIPLWISDLLPGNVHDLAAARETGLPGTARVPVRPACPG